ncbi:MAG: hypothetical protein KDI71_20170 [Xanthomonadales bacterium]|nr:hypothetical protein [Xanthomonadales bacterium]
MTTAYGFAVRTPTDMLEKARRELERFEAAAKSSSSDHACQSDHAINFAITIAHLGEWLFNAYIAKHPNPGTWLGFRKANKFTEHMCDQCSALQDCYEIANGSKHTKLYPHVAKNVRQTAEIKSGGSSIVSSPVKPLVQPIVRSLVMGDASSTVLRIVSKQGGSKLAKSTFRKALKFWEEFFHQHSSVIAKL